MRERFKAPVSVGEEFEVTIEAVGEKGDGIAKKNGFVIFVPNTKQGQHVRIRMTKVLSKVGFAEVIGEGAAHEESDEESTEEAPEGTDEGSFDEEASSEESEEDTEDFGGDLTEE